MCVCVSVCMCVCVCVCIYTHMNSIEQILGATSYKTAAIRLPPSHLQNHPNKTNKTCWTLQKK